MTPVRDPVTFRSAGGCHDQDRQDNRSDDRDRLDGTGRRDHHRVVAALLPRVDADADDERDQRDDPHRDKNPGPHSPRPVNPPRASDPRSRQRYEACNE